MALRDLVKQFRRTSTASPPAENHTNGATSCKIDDLKSATPVVTSKTSSSSVSDEEQNKADIDLPMDKWVESKLSRMTLEEKAMMLSGVDVWRTYPVPRLGIPQLKVMFLRWERGMGESYWIGC